MSAKIDIWMPLYINEYDAATARLSDAEDRAYMRLIKDYWRNGPPPDDDSVLSRIVQKDAAEWAAIRPVLLRFFKVSKGQWRHKRVDKELARARAVSDKRRAAGVAGAEARWGTDGNCHESEPENGKRNGKRIGKRNGRANGKRVDSHSNTPIGGLIESPPDRGRNPTPVRLEGRAPITQEEREKVAALWRELAAERKTGALRVIKA